MNPWGYVISYELFALAGMLVIANAVQCHKNQRAFANQEQENMWRFFPPNNDPENCCNLATLQDQLQEDEFLKINSESNEDHRFYTQTGCSRSLPSGKKAVELAELAQRCRYKEDNFTLEETFLSIMPENLQKQLNELLGKHGPLKDLPLVIFFGGIGDFKHLKLQAPITRVILEDKSFFSTNFMKQKEFVIKSNIVVIAVQMHKFDPTTRSDNMLYISCGRNGETDKLQFSISNSSWSSAPIDRQRVHSLFQYDVHEDN